MGFHCLYQLFPLLLSLDVDPVNVYYWLAIGVVTKLPDIDRQERFQQESEGESNQKLTKKELKQLKNMQRAAEFK